MATTFDFIVVGGGTAGIVVACRLAATKKAPKVLLIEAGGEADDVDYRLPFNRFLNAFTLPELDYQYATVPQKSLDGKSIPYQRGKGLGGSTLLNFMVWARGAASDYDRWAELVGSDDWNWDQVVERFRRIERFENNLDAESQNYARSEPGSYGEEGSPVPVSLPVIGSDLRIIFDMAQELGLPINPDSNSGNPVGASVNVLSGKDGLRTTSISSYLRSGKSDNLTIWTNTQVIRVILEGKVALGIETADGRKGKSPILFVTDEAEELTIALANSEIILSAGSIDTPKILLLSGIGPEEELSQLGIDVKHNLKGVGKNIQDHCGVFLMDHLGSNFNDRIDLLMTPEKLSLARKQWETDRTGPLAEHYGNAAVFFVQDPEIYDSDAFKALDVKTQEHIRKSDIPVYEVVVNGPLVPPTYVFEDKADSFLSTCLIMMNPQSRGTIKLRSVNPADPPLIDLAFMSHPWDRYILTRAIRFGLRFPKTDAVAPYWKSAINVPKSDSDEDIWQFIKDNLSPIWHANGSVMMGKASDDNACVDSDLRIIGLQNLRIADMSVSPLTPNNHTQSTAYMIGETAAEKLIKEYNLQ